MVKRVILLFALLLLPFICEAKVLSSRVIRLYSAYFFVTHPPQPTDLQYYMVNFGPGNIKFLKQVDIVLDNEGRVQGVQLIYTLPDGFRRKTFLRGVSGWTFKRARKNSISNSVLIRVVTTDELNVIW